MIRTDRPLALRYGFALVGIAGSLTLAGCGAATASDSTADADTSSSGSDSSAGDSSDSSSDAGTASYADGTYTADGAYSTPESVETITVTVTLEDDVITDVEVEGDPVSSTSVQYQSEFIGGIADVVVGVDIDDISVSRVAGSSLTSGGFNEAIETIKAEAAS